jgi:hypothetical protein
MREIAIILIASFAIDRIVTGLFFLLSYNADLRPVLDPNSIDDPAQKAKAIKDYQLIYAIVAGYLAIVFVSGVMGVRLSAITGLAPDAKAGRAINELLDILLTGLLLVGGADRLAEALKLVKGEGGKGSQAPIEITGKVVLQQESRKEDTPIAQTSV